jgi:hypothetical protein
MKVKNALYEIRYIYIKYIALYHKGMQINMKI